MRVRTLALIAFLGVAAIFPRVRIFAAPDYTIRLTSGDIIPREDVNHIITLSSKSPVHCLIQLADVPDESQRKALALAGVTLLEPVPEFAWIVRVEQSLTLAQTKNLGIRWGKELAAADKQHPRVLRGEFGAWAQYKDNRVLVSVRLHKDAAAEKIHEIAAQTDAETGGYIRSVNTWIVAVAPENIKALAAAEEVAWIDVLPPPLTSVNDVAGQVTGTAAVQAAPYNLNGDGITVCIYDGGMVDNTHSDFTGRLTWGESGAIADHATHVAGSVGGSGYLSGGQYRGMAPACDIVSFAYEACNPYCLYNSPQDIENNYQTARTTYGADLITNSIGSNIAYNGYNCAWEGDYELVSQLLDNIVRGSLGSPLTVVFAAGNERSYATCGTTYSTLSVPGGAKNVITVGATDDGDNMTSFSSWGPTDDGRIKPEVCAPGSAIYSTLQGNSYGNLNGTSMATPITSGGIALMLEQFSISYPALTPLPSTIKALLINTAVDLGNSGPDYMFGFGRINIHAAPEAILQGRFLEDQLSAGQTDTFSFDVPSGTPSLRVSLSWSDPAASPMANPTLVNDLDLALISPADAVYYPFLPNPANPSAPASTGINHRDNSEQAVVADPEAGTWTIRVSSTVMPVGPQSYSLAASQSILSGYGWATGIVTDAITLQPIDGAVVKNLSGQQSALTDTNGFYRIYLPSHSVTLEFSAFGYQTAAEIVVAPDRGTQPVNKTLAPVSTALLSGYVYDQAGIPVPDAEVQTLDSPLPPVVSGPDGYYSIALPVGGIYEIKASAAGLGAAQKTITFAGTAQANFHLFTVVACYDFETDQGWTAGAAGDNAAFGLWGRMDPIGTYNGTSIVQPEDDHTAAPGVTCYVTDGRSGITLGSYDVDGGKTTLLSPLWDLSVYQRALLDLWTWFSNDEGSSPGGDYFVIGVSSNGGANWVDLLNTRASYEYWKNQSWALENYIALTNQVRLRIVAQDQSPGSIVEAAVDDICLYASYAHPPPPPSNLVIQVEDGGILLSWQPSADALSYRIEWTSDMNSSFVPLDSVSAGTTGYFHNIGLDSVQAFYRVIAKN